MQKSALIFAICSRCVLAYAGENPAGPGTPLPGTLSSYCSQNAHWNSSNPGGSCEVQGALGQRKLVVNDYTDSDADSLIIEVCTTAGVCTTDTIVMDVAAVHDTSVVVASYADCGTKVWTVAVTNWENETTTTTITEGTDFTAVTSNDATAALLCPLITAIHGVSSTVSTATCPVLKTGKTRTVVVTSSNSTCSTVTNYDDDTSECLTSDERCAHELREKLRIGLTLGTLSGFSITAPSAYSDTTGFIPDITTTELNIMVVNSANDPFGTVTAGSDGALIVRKPAVITGEIRFCGVGPNGTTANYLGPVLLDDTEADLAFGGAGCDALDHTTEATADAPFHAAFVPLATSLLCTTSCTSSGVLTLSVRSAAAALDADLTCDIRIDYETQCTALDASPTAIAAGATVAIKVVNSTAGDCSGGDVECIVGITY